MRVLPVNFDQTSPQLLQGLQGHRPPIHEGPGTAIDRDDATDQAPPVLGQLVILQPNPGGRAVHQIEAQVDLGPLRTGTDIGRIRPIAQSQTERRQQYGLARTGLAGQDGESRLELKFERLHYDEITNIQMFQHG